MIRRVGAGAVLGLLLLLGVGGVDLATAQRKIGTAVVKTVTGRVELERKGEDQWGTLVAGARLAEGDQVRAYPGASAALDLPDGSTLLVSENSRVVISKLEYDVQDQTRQAFFHLVVGKVRAIVSTAAITLVKARQSNFVISTPTAVAAARGTVYEVVYDALQNMMRVAVLVKDPQKPTGLVSCLSLYDRFSSVLVREGLAATATGTEGCAPPVPISRLADANLVGTMTNPVQPGPAFSSPVTVPNIADLPGLNAGAPPVVFTSDPGDTLSPAPPSTIGQDIGQPQAPATGPASQ
jgi:hypothetical protein